VATGEESIGPDHSRAPNRVVSHRDRLAGRDLARGGCDPVGRRDPADRNNSPRTSRTAESLTLLVLIRGPRRCQWSRTCWTDLWPSGRDSQPLPQPGGTPTQPLRRFCGGGTGHAGRMPAHELATSVRTEANVPWGGGRPGSLFHLRGHQEPCSSPHVTGVSSGHPRGR